MQSSLIRARRILLLLIADMTDLLLERLIDDQALTARVVEILENVMGPLKPHIRSITVDRAWASGLASDVSIDSRHRSGPGLKINPRAV